MLRWKTKTIINEDGENKTDVIVTSSKNEIDEFMADCNNALPKIGDTVQVIKPKRYIMKEELKSKVEALEREISFLKARITTAYDAIHDVSNQFQMVRQYLLSIKADIESGE